MRIKSETEKRLIVEGQVNGKSAYFLIDTGASVGLIDKAKKKKYGLKEGFLYSLHHMPAQILLVGLLMKKMTKHPIRKRGMQVFLVINLLVVLVLDWVGWDMMLASIR